MIMHLPLPRFRGRLHLARQRGPLVLLLSIAMLGLGATAASAFTCTAQCTPPASAISAPTPETGGRWGERTVAVGADLSSPTDSINDVWVADPFATAGASLAQAGKVYLVSGASMVNTTSTTPTTPTVIYTLTAPTPVTKGHFGFVISNIGDVNADSKPDLAVGVDANDPTTGASTGNGNVWVYNGASGALLYTINNPNAAATNDRFGSRIGNAGDIYNTTDGLFVGNGTTAADGSSEIIVGASNATVGTLAGVGKAYIFDGNPAAYSGTPPSSNVAVRTFTAPQSTVAGTFGLSVQGPGNFNGDVKGVPDQVISAPAATVGTNVKEGEMYVYDGTTGNLIKTLNDPTPQANAFFGFQDVTPKSPGDVNADGKADIYADGWLQDVTNTDEGKAWVFAGTATTGATNIPLYSITDNHAKAGGQFGWSMTDTTLGSGTTKVLLVGASPHSSTSANEDGGAYLYTSSNGVFNKDLPLPQGYQQATATGNAGPNLGWTVSAPGALKSGSTSQTYLAGAPFVDNTSSPAHQDEGLIFTFWDDGTGSYSHAYCPANSNGSRTTATCT